MAISITSSTWLRDSTATMPPSTFALLFIHITLPENQKVPATLTHRIHLKAEAAPPGQQEITETAGETAVNTQVVVAIIGPPLRGANYISADSCCDATRHTRAALPVNGRVWVAQRYAVDWEQLDDANRIYHGPRESLASYTIFGKEAIAVADAARHIWAVRPATERADATRSGGRRSGSVAALTGRTTRR